MLHEEIKKVYQIARAVAREEIAKALDELKASQAVPSPEPPPVEENKEEEDEL